MLSMAGTADVADAVVVAVGVAASVPAGLRFLRVSQREHYLPGAASCFARRWWASTGEPAPRWSRSPRCRGEHPYLLPGGRRRGRRGARGRRRRRPLGLGVRGRTAPLVWTPRCRRLAAVAAVPVVAAGIGSGVGSLPWLPGLVALLLPAVVDGAAAVLAPVERRLGNRWVVSAAERLRSSGARVVAITGSYGKTTTKAYVAHLLAGTMKVLASPGSFNNRMGLATAINDHLDVDVDVFVAEMGTYGRGEIADLCRWIPPDVAVMTAVGPVHLERMGSEEAIVEAKREILASAPTAVIGVDHPLLAALADEEASRRKVIRASAVDPGADVFADPATGEVLVSGSPVGSFDPASAHAGDVACAVGAVVGLGARRGGRRRPPPGSPRTRPPPSRRPQRAGVPHHRRHLQREPGGGEGRPRQARPRRGAAGRRHSGDGRARPLQFSENRRFAAEAGRVATDLVVVGRTNRAALLAGAAEAGLPSVIVVGSREEAVAWVRARLGEGDAVLYENDLPDHYP